MTLGMIAAAADPDDADDTEEDGDTEAGSDSARACAPAVIPVVRHQLLEPRGVARPDVEALARLLGELLVEAGWSWTERQHREPVFAMVSKPELAVVSPDRRVGVALASTITRSIANPGLSLYDFATEATALEHAYPALHWYDVASPPFRPAPRANPSAVATRVV